MIGLEFIKGAALLLSLTLLQGFVMRAWRKDTPAWRVASGLLFGVIVLVGMLLPIELQPGVIFDPRSVILSVAGFWGGPLVGAIAGAMALAYRIWLGGAGMSPGVAVIVWSVAAGVAYRHLHRQQGWPAGPWPMLGFGFVVHLGVVLLFIALFGDIAWDVVQTVALPNLLIFSPATMFLGFLLADIDRRAATEGALRHSEARLQAIIDHALSPISIKDAQGNILLVNRQTRAIFGSVLDDCIGKNVFDLFPHDIAESFFQADQAALAAGGPVELEETVRHADGTSHTYITVKFPVSIAGKAPFGICAISTDITARKQAEESLRQSEERYRTIVESVGEGVWEIDADARTTFVNRRLTEMLGYPYDEMIGRPLADFVAEGRRPEAEQQLARSQAGTAERGDLLLRRKDGEGFWATVSISPRLDEEGRFRSATALVTDISADRAQQDRIHALEKQLLHTSRATLMGELASSFAHQLNQPLAGISSFSQGLVQRFSSGNVDPPELQKVLAIIDEQSRRAAEIVRRIRQFLQKRDEVTEVVDVDAAIHEVKALLLGEARRRDVDIQIHPGRLGLAVNGDPVLLQQVFANIVTNAFEAMADVDIGQRLVEISSLPDANGLVKIEIRDHGPGLDEEALKRVFDPFFTRKVHGLGMGLAICRSIVERYGGRIRAGNHGSGGAVFEIALPAAKEAADAPEA